MGGGPLLLLPHPFQTCTYAPPVCPRQTRCVTQPEAQSSRCLIPLKAWGNAAWINCSARLQAHHIPGMCCSPVQVQSLAHTVSLSTLHATFGRPAAYARPVCDACIPTSTSCTLSVWYSALPLPHAGSRHVPCVSTIGPCLPALLVDARLCRRSLKVHWALFTMQLL